MSGVKENRPRRVRLESDARKQQLVEATANLIATQGYSSTSIRDVAARVGISTGTVLHHYPTKEDLLIGTLRYIGDSFLAHMTEATSADVAAAEKLRRFARASLESPRHDIAWRVWIAFWHEASINPELAPAAFEQSAATEAILTHVIAEGSRRGELRAEDPGLRAVEFLVLIEGCAIRLFGEPGRLSSEQAISMIDQLVEDWTPAT